MTNIEQLFADINKFGWELVKDKVNFYKEKEKRQIIDACKYGNTFEQGDLICEVYYNQTYK